jgi:hypothetical protein
MVPNFHHFSNITRSLEGNLYHVPCLGHVINLAVQAMLGPAGLNDEPPKNDNLYSDDDGDDDDYVDDDEALFQGEVVKLITLKKLRKGIVKIRCNRLVYSWQFLMKL